MPVPATEADPELVKRFRPPRAPKVAAAPPAPAPAETPAQKRRRKMNAAEWLAADAESDEDEVDDDSPAEEADE